MLGRDLLRLIFGTGDTGRPLPAPLPALIASAGSSPTLIALEAQVAKTLEENAGLAAQLSEMLAGFYRQQLECGDGNALADLGGFLWWDDPQQARAAFELRKIIDVAVDALAGPAH